MKTTIRRAIMGVAAAVLLPGPLAAQHTVLQGREVTVATGCPDAEPLGWLGIQGFRCFNCSVGMVGEGEAYTFSTEPEITAVDPSGPAHGLIEAGDVLVAVDDKLITTAQGQQAFSHVEPGEWRRITFRRGGDEQTVSVAASESCSPPNTISGHATGSLEDADRQYDWITRLLDVLDRRRVRTTPVRAWSPIKASPPERGELPPAPPTASASYLGLSLRVTQGTIRTEESGRTTASFLQPPEVIAVDPDGPAERAQIREGDVILKVDDLDITDSDGASRLMSIRPGETLRLVIRRPSGAHGNVRLTADGPPAPKSVDAQPLRFSGQFGPADVTVWGPPVTVEMDNEDGVLIIRTKDTVMRVRVGGRAN